MFRPTSSLSARASLRRRLVPTYVALAFVVTLLLLSVGYAQMRRVYVDDLTHDLEARTRLLAAALTRGVQVTPDVCAWAASTLDARVLLLNEAAIVLCDSDGIAMAGQTAYREEIQALTITANASSRERLERNRATVWVRSGSEWFVRASIPIEGIRGVWRHFDVMLPALLSAVLLVALLLGRTAAAAIAGPIVRLTVALEHSADGTRPSALALPDIQELADLVSSFNVTLAGLNGRAATAEAQHGELQAVLNSMVEGVIAIDADQRIFNVNRAACELLGLQLPVMGRTVREVLRLPAFHRFIDAILATPGTHESEAHVEMQGRRRTLRLRGSRIKPAGTRSGAAVVVVEDVTHVRYLEQMRRDFAANVSHELKTPITAVKGYAETLLNGALSDPEAAQRFVAAIVRHADRLTAIIEDLLTLARIERIEEGGMPALDVVEVQAILADAVATGTELAVAARTDVVVECPPNLAVRGNAALLGQAIANLFINAIKYSDQGTRVVLAADGDGERVRISVTDQGRGIPREAQARLFERFYRVDAARTRDEGGTGLGLAIVKHTARVHGGDVRVRSAPGVGSTFTIELPLAHPPTPSAAVAGHSKST